MKELIVSLSTGNSFRIMYDSEGYWYPMSGDGEELEQSDLTENEKLEIELALDRDLQEDDESF